MNNELTEKCRQSDMYFPTVNGSFSSLVKIDLKCTFKGELGTHCEQALILDLMAFCMWFIMIN